MRILLKYFFVLIFPIVLVLPLPLIFSSSALGLALLNLLTVRISNKQIKKGIKLRKKEAILLIAGMVVLFLDVFTHFFRNFEPKLIFREVRISLFLVPVIFYLCKIQLRPIKKHLLFSLVIGVLCYLLYAYGYMIYFYSTIKFRSFEFSHYLVYDLRQNLPGAYHHTYIGMYSAFAIAIVLFKSVKKYDWQRLTLSIFIALNQILIGSKITFLISILIIGLYLLQKAIENRKFLLKTMAIAGVVALTIIILIRKASFFNSVSFSVSNRIESWICSLKAFSENPIWGLGHENSVKFLNSCISTDAISTHNQFLDEIINYGIFGFWLPIFFGLIFFKFRSNKLFKYFIFITFIVCLFENILSLQRGVLFFSFFVSLFFMWNEKREVISS